MKRFTYMDSGKWRVKLGDHEIRAGFVDRLAEYESIGLTPSEIRQQLEEYKAYRHVCGGYAPEEIQKIIAEHNRSEIEQRIATEKDKRAADAFEKLLSVIDAVRDMRV